MDKCREAFEDWFRTTKAYQMLEEQNYFKMDLFHFVDGRNEYRHTSVQIAFMTWQSQQAEINQLQSQINEMAEVGLIQESAIRGKDKRIESALSELESLHNKKWAEWKEQADMHSQGEANAYEHAMQILEKVLRGEHE